MLVVMETGSDAPAALRLRDGPPDTVVRLGTEATQPTSLPPGGAPTQLPDVMSLVFRLGGLRDGTASVSRDGFRSRTRTPGR
ncbi:Ubiquitin Carboxyl-Terminal Hydrolase 32 [Manis pentadactyla]|nr:Ubiquitin Carboxyl-Terminal Hydrolase 32 [Manis pentadactyla]